MKSSLFPNSFRHHVVALVIGVLAVVVLTNNLSYAQNGSWNVDADGNWSTAGNWLGSTVADGADNTATFPDNISANRVVTLDSARTIGNITFSDTSHHLTISPAAAEILTLDTTSGTPTINVADEELTISSVIDGNDGLSKTGAGLLLLGGSNTYTGGTIIDGGRVNINSDASLGTGGTGITFNASATLNPTVNVTSARQMTLNNNAAATLLLGVNNSSITFENSGQVTGNGGITVAPAANGNIKTARLTNTTNDFTGPITIENNTGATRVLLEMSSLADSASTITFDGTNSQTTFDWRADAVGALTLNNRQFELASGNTRGIIDNSFAGVMTINTDLIVTGTGNKSLQLLNTAAGSSGVWTGNIDEGSSTLGLTIQGAWDLSGTNAFSGTTTLNAGATLRLLGGQAIAPNATYQMFRSTTLDLRTDAAGTVNGASGIVLNRNDTSTTLIQNYTVNVENNGGATTGTIVNVGDLDFSQNDMRPPRQLNTTGNDGYSVQIGDVTLATELQNTTLTDGPQRIHGNTAAIEITGTIKQVDGSTGTRPNSNKLFLGGTNTGNLVSGVIADADDYTNATNLNAAPLNVYKGESGQWTLTGVNTYTGDTTINNNGGTLEIGGAGRLGSGSYAGDISIGSSATFAYNSTADQTLSGDISGAGALVKNNSGTLTLSGTNSYGGLTDVDGGTLLVNGDNSGATGAVSVASGATLGGTGTIGGATTIAAGGLLSPGDLGVGNLTIDDTLDISGALTGSGSLLFDLGPGLAGDVATLTTGNALTIGSGLLNFDDFVFINLGVTAGTYTLFDTDTPINTSLGTLLSGTIDGFDATLSFANGNNDIVLTLVEIVVPEPSTLILTALGLLCLLAITRRERRRGA